MEEVYGLVSSLLPRDNAMTVSLLAPEIEVRLSAGDYFGGRDAVLEVVLGLE